MYNTQVLGGIPKHGHRVRVPDTQQSCDLTHSNVTQE